jgi:DNA-binding PadR family transcriptional regulator
VDAKRRSALGLVILGMLIEEPMHAYRMQKLIRDRGKDTVVNVRQRTSVHQTLNRLQRLGLICVFSTKKSATRPDRTIYSITPLGRNTAQAWLCEMLTTVGTEFPEFPAAVATISMLTPTQVRRQFEIRGSNIRAELSKLEMAKREAGALPRLFLLEDECRIALLSAELSWLENIIADLRSGALVWDRAWLRKTAAAFAGPDSEERVGNLPSTKRRLRVF